MENNSSHDDIYPEEMGEFEVRLSGSTIDRLICYYYGNWIFPPSYTRVIGDKIVEFKLLRSVSELKNLVIIDNKGKKSDEGKLPLGIVIQKQFPNALRAVAQCSLYGHNKYEKNDEDWLNYQRLENAEQRYSDAMIRHFLAEDNGLDESGLEHIIHTCWNSLARLELHLKNKK